MNETKIVAAILTMAASAREPRAPSQEIGKEYWRKVIRDYKQILQELSKSSSS